MAEVLIPRRTINKQEYVLLADVTVDTATTSVDITGLNIGKEEEIVLVSDIVNPTASITNYSFYINNNNTTTNYYFQNIEVSSSSVGGNRANMNIVVVCASSSKTSSITNLKLTNNGYLVWQSNNNRQYGTSSLMLQNLYGTSTFTSTSITSLLIQASVSNAIGIGSRFQLYKAGA